MFAALRCSIALLSIALPLRAAAEVAAWIATQVELGDLDQTQARAAAAELRALRAQSDRNGYSREMRRVLAATPGITLIEGEVGEIITSSSADVPSANSGVGAEQRSARAGLTAKDGGRSVAPPLRNDGSRESNSRRCCWTANKIRRYRVG